MARLATIDVLMRLNSDEFKKGIEDMSAKAQKMGASMTSAGTAMSRNLTAPIVALGAALGASAISVGNYADEVLDLAQMTGLTTDEIQRFRGVAIAAGVSTDTIANAAMMLTRQMAQGEEGSANMRLGMQALGISMTDAAGKMRPVGDVTQEAIAALADMEDMTQRNILATQVFGRSASELAPVLGLGSAAIQEATDNAEKYAGMLDHDALKAADAFRQEVENLTASFGRVAREVGIAVIPVMSQLVGLLQDNVVPIILRMVEIFSSIPAPIQTVIGIVAALVAALGPLLVILGTITSAIGALLPVIAGLAGVLGAPILVPLAAVTAAVVALVVAFRVFPAVVDMVRSGVSAIIGFMKRLGDAILTPLRPIQRLESAFAWLYDRVVGNSYVPDMVDGIEFEFSRLDAVMVQPALRATAQVESAFGQMAGNVTAAMRGLGSELGGVAGGVAQQMTIIADALGIRLGGQAGERQRQAQEAAQIARARQTGYVFSQPGMGGTGGAASVPSPAPSMSQSINISGPITLPNVSNPQEFLDELLRIAGRQQRAGGGNAFQALLG